MTNRPDLIDDALKRPGRLEVHKEIGKSDNDQWIGQLVEDIKLDMG